MALFEDKPRIASATANGQTILWLITREEFLKLLNSDLNTATTLLMAIISTTLERLNKTNQAVITLYEIGKIIGGNQGSQNIPRTPAPLSPLGNTSGNTGVVPPTQIPLQITKPSPNIDSVKRIVRSVPPLGWAAGVTTAAKLLKAGWILAAGLGIGTYIFTNKV